MLGRGCFTQLAEETTATSSVGKQEAEAGSETFNEGGSYQLSEFAGKSFLLF